VPTLPELAELLTDDKPLDRTTVNSWEDLEFVQAVHTACARSRCTGVTPGMDIFASEIFGPATVIHPVNSTEAAIDLANDTEYGLTSGVITRDLTAALDVVSRVRSGIIHINDQGIADEPMAPFGGVKNSGYGKFGGTAGIESFTEQRWVTIQHNGRPAYPF
jgi:vanillin dehydrogenase